MDLDISADAAALAVNAARWIGGRIRHHVGLTGRCTIAFSGGSTPPSMFAALARLDLPWDRVHVFQVDERVAPAGHPDRNATALRRDLLDRIDLPPANLHLIPVDDLDAAEAAAAYAATLQAVCEGRLDVVHLGLGEDGHTASWAAGDRVLQVRDADVEVAGPLGGRLRVTLTPPCVNRAASICFLVSGRGKRDVLHRLLHGDPAIPAALVRQEGTVVLADRAAFE